MNEPPGAPQAPAPLLDLIRAQIAAAGGRITFAEYMDLALYEPRYGYYSAGAVALGRGGDFTTSPEVDPAFGACLAEFAARCDAALDHPAHFLLAEHGAGSGRLMADMLDALRADHAALWPRVRPVIVERSPALRERQRARLAAAGHGGAGHLGRSRRGRGARSSATSCSTPFPCAGCWPARTARCRRSTLPWTQPAR